MLTYPEPIPSAVLDLTLDVTGLASAATVAGTLLRAAGGIAETDSVIRARCLATLEAWETLTGLPRDAAFEVAQRITRHPGQTTAAVIPL